MIRADVPVAVRKGVPALVGVDVSRRLGQGDWFPTRMRDFAGPALSTGYNLTRDTWGILTDAANREKHLEKLGGDASPWLGHLMSVARQAGGEGPTGYRDRLRYEPTWTDAFWHLSGFTPLESTETSDREQVARNDMRRQRETRRQAIDDIVAARKRGDSKLESSILSKTDKQGIRILPRDILAEERKKEMPVSERMVKQAPRGMRPSIEDLFE